MKILTFFWVAAATFFFASTAYAQNPGAVTNHAFVIGKGAGTTGYTSLLCGSAQLAVGQTSADPICRTITGDVTLSAAGATAIGATKVTSAMLNADVFSTAHTWAGQQTFVAPILGTPASGTLTNTTGLPISTGVSGLGTNVATALGVNVGSAGAFVVNGGALGTPSSGTLTNATGYPIANLAGAGTGVLTALGVNIGSAGAPVLFNGAGGTPSSLVLTNATGLPVGGHAALAAYTFLGNNTGSSATPTAVDIAALTTKASPAAGDYVMLSDQAASGAWKKATVSSVSSAGSVSSIAGNTGAFTLSNGITNSTNDIRLDPATQAEMEAASITTKAVTPGRQHNHPGVAKAWMLCRNSAGTYTLAASYNNSGGCNKTGVGELNPSFANSMSSSDYACTATASNSNTIVSVSPNTGANFFVSIRNGGAAADATVSIVCFGDQ